jgi:hypothetical protein
MLHPFDEVAQSLHTKPERFDARFAIVVSPKKRQLKSNGYIRLFLSAILDSEKSMGLYIMSCV